MTTRCGTPIWMAASPMPGAAYMVSNMSSTSLRSDLSTAFTGSELSRSRLSGKNEDVTHRHGRDVRARGGAVNARLSP